MILHWGRLPWCVPYRKLTLTSALVMHVDYFPSPHWGLKWESTAPRELGVLPPFRGDSVKLGWGRRRTADNQKNNKNKDNKIIIKNDVTICRNMFGNSSHQVRKVCKKLQKCSYSCTCWVITKPLPFLQPNSLPYLWADQKFEPHAFMTWTLH